MFLKVNFVFLILVCHSMIQGCASGQCPRSGQAHTLTGMSAGMPGHSRTLPGHQMLVFPLLTEKMKNSIISSAA